MGTAASNPHLERFRRLDAAFRAGDLTTLRNELGSHDGFPNVIADRAMGPCLTYAIYHGPLALIDALLEVGADPNWPTDDGFPPLIAALGCLVPSPGATARADIPQVMELLLAHGAGVHQRGVNDDTPLHVAARQGDPAMVDLLLAHGADPDARTRIDLFETPLDVAAAAGHVQVVERLAPLTAAPDWEAACKAGDVGVLQRLLSAGHDIEKRDRYGGTSLMRAAHAGYAETVDWLIARGADLDHTAKYNLSALMLAVLSGHDRIARALVAAGADTTVKGTGAPGFLGRTAADLAEDRGEMALAEFLRAGSPAGPA